MLTLSIQLCTYFISDPLGSTVNITVADVSSTRLAVATVFIPEVTPWNPKLNKDSTTVFLDKDIPSTIESTSVSTVNNVNMDTKSIPSQLPNLPSSTPNVPNNIDFTIEVSGHPSGLQTAIDTTTKGGRIIIGSWYGEASSSLRLGISFHRSNLHLITSQVSFIPSELCNRWDKKRRFDLTWNVLRKIQPSRLLNKTLDIVSLRSPDVLDAYKRLEKGQCMTILFK